MFNNRSFDLSVLSRLLLSYFLLIL